MTLLPDQRSTAELGDEAKGLVGGTVVEYEYVIHEPAKGSPLISR